MPKINPSHCPQGMTLKEWQRALRRQAAGKEHFGIIEPQTPGDPFIVSSAKSGRKYRVEYCPSIPRYILIMLTARK